MGRKEQNKEKTNYVRYNTYTLLWADTMLWLCS